MRAAASLNGSMMAARGRCIVTQVLPRRKRMWSLSMRSSVHGPVSAAALAISRSTVGGGRPWKGDCSAKLGGATDAMAMRDRFKFSVCAVWLCACVCASAGPPGCEGMGSEMSVEAGIVVGLCARRCSSAVLSRRRRAAGACVGGFAIVLSVGCFVSSASSAGNQTAIDGGCALSCAHRIPRSADHHINTPARWRPTTTKITLAWLARRCSVIMKMIAHRFLQR